LFTSPADLDNDYCPSVELIGDIAQTLTALTSLLKRGGRSADMLQAIAAGTAPPQPRVDETR
jgi:thiamine pyrophosphate-dependent acetolactate synthase large subunit-like protein